MFQITRENIRLVTYIVVSTVFFLFETVSPYKPHTESRWIHIVRNVVIAVINAVGYGVVFGFAVEMITSWTATHQFGVFPVLGLPFVPELLLTIIVLDAVIYLWHRILHRVPFLWRFHLVHHVDSRLDFTSGFRFHLGEMIGSMVFHLPFYFLLGVSFDALLIYQMLLLFFTPLAHTNIRLPSWIDTPLRMIFVTPNFHQIHHSEIPLEAHSNYSTVFSFWDRIFKSYTARRDIEHITTGFKGFGLNMSFYHLMILPFFLQQVRKESQHHQ